MTRITVVAALVAAGAAAAQDAPPAASLAAAPPRGYVQPIDRGKKAPVDPEVLRGMEIERMIVDRVAETYGRAAVLGGDGGLSERLLARLTPGMTLPADAPVREVPGRLGDLPTLRPASRWVRVGDNLIEVGPDNRIVLAVMDVL